jgi:hypothetical protein
MIVLQGPSLLSRSTHIYIASLVHSYSINLVPHLCLPLPVTDCHVRFVVRSPIVFLDVYARFSFAHLPSNAVSRVPYMRTV